MNKKGFTLIELLAVIVILAIIALIATPTILGVIETARQGAAKSSALGYIDAVEKQIAIDMVAGTTVIDYADDNTITVGTDDTGLTLKGEAPTAGTVTIDATKGIISKAALKVEMNSKEYCVQYANSNVTSVTAMGEDATCELAA